LRALGVEPQSRLLTGRDRIEVAQPLDVPAVATFARVRDDNVIEGPLLGAAARQANNYHALSLCKF
jgi:hypothetical protein